jgi:transcription elongation factor Elf1
MNKCIIHNDKEALSICHGCGKDFCEICLDEGTEYYYCKNPECQNLLKNELPQIKILDNIFCPQCKTEFKLSDEEKTIGKIHCNECDKILDFTVDPPKLLDIDNYTELISTLNQGDIALIKSILDDAEIDYIILGESFLSVRPLLEAARIFVNASQINEAQAIIKDLELNIFGISTKQIKD